MPKRIIPIKYTSREFDSIKSSLVDYVQRYYPDTFKDFSEASFGSLMLDTVSYIGDVLSFYLDYQANECFLDTAVEYNNIIRLGKQLGYKFKGNPSSYGTASFYLLVPSSSITGGPDEEYMPTLKKHSQFKSKSDANFILDEDVNFSLSNNEVRAATINSLTGAIEKYAVKAYGRVTSGILSQETIEIGTHKKFLRVSLGTLDVAEIMSVIDTEGHEYYEVEHLSQDVIYKAVTNRDTDTNNGAPAILKPVIVPRRFVVERERHVTYLQFGGGSDIEFNTENIINASVVDPSNVVLRRHGAPHISDSSFDPYKLVASDEFGIAPSNTVLRVVMRVNTMDNVNLSVGSLNTVKEAKFEFNDNSLAEIGNVERSLEVANEESIVGDVTLPDGVELKRRILDSFATQNRAVTAKDYEAMAYAMPPEFGAIKRCKIARDHGSMKRNLNMYVVSEHSGDFLTEANDTIKNNLKTWLTKNKMINDTIDILDAKIINFAIHYEAVGRSDVSKFEVIEAANAALRTHYQRTPEIGEPIWITDVYKILKEIDGIVDVSNVDIISKFGNEYSSVNLDIAQNASSDGRYIEIPRNCIAEVKFIQSDIKGVIK